MAQDSDGTDDTDDKLSLSFRRKRRGKKAVEPAAEPVADGPGEPASTLSETDHSAADEPGPQVAADADAQTEAEVAEPVEDEETIVLPNDEPAAAEESLTEAEPAERLVEAPADEIDEPEATGEADQAGETSGKRRWWSRSAKSGTESDADEAAEVEVDSPGADASAEDIDLYATADDAEDTSVLEPDDDVAGEYDADPGAQEPAARRTRSFALPALDGRLVAVVTGLVVGLLGVALTYLFERGCQAVKGTGSCGGVGVLLLVVVLVAMVFVGGVLLARWRQPDALSTSFLAVGVVAVVAMLAFLRWIDRWYMVLVIPLLTAAAYLFSWWVTVRVINGGGIGEATADDAGEPANDDLWDDETAEASAER